MAGKYRTTPVLSTRVPAGIPYIVGNEAAERFSFYGMKALLIVFMTTFLVTAGGSRDVMPREEAMQWFHNFVAATYGLAIVGALISDGLLGKYRTIMSLSIVYCLGHLALAMDQTRWGLFIGLMLIAIGAGGIKPCVSAHVGDQFGSMNKHMLKNMFGWFYFAINLGAAASMLATPLLRRHFGIAVAFGVPGVLMLTATIIFWLGRHKFVHVPPGGIGFLRESFSGEGLKVLLRLSIIFLCIAMFWAMFDQSGSAWVLQTKRMNRVLGIEWMPSQMPAVNAFLILALIPVFSYMIYPAIDRVFPLTPLRKISIGFFVALAASAVPALIALQITGGQIVDVTSEGDADQWPAQNLIDGKADGSGWLSVRTPDFPHDIVLRLRRRRAWNIASVRLNPFIDRRPLAAFDTSGDGRVGADEIAAARRKEASLWTRLNVFAPSPGPYTSRTLLEKFDTDRDGRLDRQEAAAVEKAERNIWAKDVEVSVSDSRKGPWQSVARVALKQDNAMQAIEFPSVRAQYVRVRIASNWGGDCVGLGEVEVCAADPLPPDASAHTRDVWPNVAATGFRPNIIWQLVAYTFLTAAEIMISITGLEFAYTQAPRKMKSIITSLYLLAVAVGNKLVALVNLYIENDDGSSKLEGANYYWFFAAIVFVTALVFIVVAKLYRGKTYIQGEDDTSA